MSIQINIKIKFIISNVLSLYYGEFLGLIAFALMVIIAYNVIHKKKYSYVFIYYFAVPIISIVSIFIARDPLVGMIASPNNLLDAFYPTMGLVE